MTWRNRNLYLLGLPGAGKTAIGRELTQLLAEYSYTFIDLDAEIEREAVQTVAEIFAMRGEQYFRDLETKVLLGLAATNHRHNIVATGGGVMLSPLNRSIIRGSGIPIWIDVSVREAAANVWKDITQGMVRPLSQASSEENVREKLRLLLESRRPYYEQAILHFVTRNSRIGERTPKELAGELLTALDQMSFKVALKPRFRMHIAHSALGRYPIAIGNGSSIGELAHTLREMKATQVITVMDTNVDKLYGKDYRIELLEQIGQVKTHTIVIEPGEANKNDRTLFDILKRFDEFEASRSNTLIVAFGGGVVTDLAGFAASIYKRGIPLVHIPTTLLAQVDAAIGGKTGVDLFGSKNLAGTFYAPKQVLIDPIYLKTLPKRELHAGLGEVFKYALIGSRPIWESLAKQVRRLVRGIDAAYEEIICESAHQKLRYVEADEFERLFGARELLNFGHTFGHALEAATGFTILLHGEAVLLGMRTAAWLSNALGYLSEDEWKEIEIVLGRIPLKVSFEVDTEHILAAFKRDKKSNGTNRVILLRAIGDAFVCEISDDDARRAIHFMLSLV